MFHRRFHVRNCLRLRYSRLLRTLLNMARRNCRIRAARRYSRPARSGQHLMLDIEDNADQTAFRRQAGWG